MFYLLHGLRVPRVRYYQSVESAYLETNQSAGNNNNNNGYCQILSGRAIGPARAFQPVLIATQSDLPPQSITDAQQPIIVDATPTGFKTSTVPPLVKTSIQVQQDYVDNSLYDARAFTPRPLNPGSRDRCPPVYINTLLETLVLDVIPIVSFWITPRGAIWRSKPTACSQVETPIEVVQPAIAVRGAPFVNVAPQVVKVYLQAECDYEYTPSSVSKTNVLNIAAPRLPLVNDRVNVEYFYSTPCFLIAALPYVVTIPKQPLISLESLAGQPNLEIGTANLSKLTPEPPRGSSICYTPPQTLIQDGAEDGRQVQVQRGPVANPVQTRITIGGGHVNIEYLYSTPSFLTSAPPYVVTVPKQPLISLASPTNQPDLELGTANLSKLTSEPPKGSNFWYINAQTLILDETEKGRQVQIDRGPVANPVQSRITIGGGHVSMEYLYSTPCLLTAAPPYVVTIPKQPLISATPLFNQSELEVGISNLSRLTPEPPRGSSFWYVKTQTPMQDGLEDGKQVSVQRGAIANPVQSCITVSIGGGQPDSYEVTQPWIVSQKGGGDRPYAQPIIQKSMSDYEQVSIYIPPVNTVRNAIAPLPNTYTVVMSVSQQTVTDFNPMWNGYSIIVNTTGVFTAPNNSPEILNSSPHTPIVSIKGRG